MVRLLIVCLFGGLGSVSRYYLSGWMVGTFGKALPWGTLAVNVIGSCLLGVVAASSLSPQTKLALGTGFMGGFTTYSAFNQETVSYFKDGAYGLGVIYIATTLAACLSAGFAGAWAIRR